MTELATDVCVIGGGPAGASMALRLAQLGRRVCIVDRGASAPAPAAQALTPSIAPLLEALGVLPRIEGAGFLRCKRTRLRWFGRDEALYESHSLIVERGEFDSILLDATAASGSTVLRPARARRPIRTAEHWIVPVDAKSGLITVQARFLVDAAGRRGPQSRLGPSSAVLCGRWRGTQSADAPEMLVEAGSNAWFWGAPQPDGLYVALVFLGTRDCAGLSHESRESLYRSLVGSSVLLEHCLSGVLVGGVAVHDATVRIADEPVTARSIRVGDAAFAMDPISSQGIQAAVRSGVQGAVVVETILSGGDKEAAIEFYCDAQLKNAERHRRIAAGVYASQSLHVSPFWRKRSKISDWRQPTPLAEIALSPEMNLKLSPDARLLQLPVLDGNVIRRCSALSHPALEGPVAWLGGVEVGPALSIISTGKPLAIVLDDWSSSMAPATARQVLSWLLQRGVLERSKG